MDINYKKEYNSQYLKSFSRRSGRGLNPKHKIFVRESGFVIQTVPNELLAQKKIHLEIGFGSGEHLMDKIVQDTENTCFIGCEVYLNAAVKFISKISENSPPLSKLATDSKMLVNLGAQNQNTLDILEDSRTQGGLTSEVELQKRPNDFFRSKKIFLWLDDARILLNKLPNNFIDKVEILFPDPWPKQKHHKRRLVNDYMLLLLHEKMKKNGKILLATDCEDYAQDIIVLTKQHNNLWKITSKRIYNFDECIKEGINTKYAKKAFDTFDKPYLQMICLIRL